MQFLPPTAFTDYIRLIEQKVPVIWLGHAGFFRIGSLGDGAGGLTLTLRDDSDVRYFVVDPDSILVPPDHAPDHARPDPQAGSVFNCTFSGVELSNPRRVLERNDLDGTPYLVEIAFDWSNQERSGLVFPESCSRLQFERKEPSGIHWTHVHLDMQFESTAREFPSGLTCCRWQKVRIRKDEAALGAGNDAAPLKIGETTRRVDPMREAMQKQKRADEERRREREFKMICKTEPKTIDYENDQGLGPPVNLVFAPEQAKPWNRAME